MSLQKGLFFWFCLCLCCSLFAGEEDDRNRIKYLYLTPLEVILPAEVLALDTEERLFLDPDTGVALREKPNRPPEIGSEEPVATGPKSAETKVKEAEGLLKRYYSQFIDEKRIWEERERGSIYSSRTEQNDIRLLLFETTHRNSETLLVKESPILYELHIRLARLYSEIDKPAIAIRHFIGAYRYRSLATTDEFYRSPNWQKEDFRNQFVAGAKSHQQAFDEKKEAQTQLKVAKDKIHILEAEAIRSGKSVSDVQGSVEAQLRVIEQKKKSLIKAEEQFAKSESENYLNYQKTKQIEDSKNFFEMAKMIKKIEDENKERLKIINKLSVAGKGIFVLFDYKKNRDFFAYELFLEKSYSLWNENIDAIQEVSERFRIDGRKEKAIDFYEKYIKLLETKNDTSEETTKKLSIAYFRLASLNADSKRYIVAGDNYEKFYAIAPDDALKTKVAFEMGNYFLNTLGDPKKASVFYEYWLDRNSKDWNPSLSEEKNSFDLEALAFLGLSKLDRVNRNPDAEKSKLLVSLKNYKDLESARNGAEKKVLELKEKRMKIKRELITTTQDEALSQFRILEIKIEDQESELRGLESKLLSIPISKILFRLAVLSESQRDFNNAMVYYDSVIEKGIETDIDLAMREKKRVRRILETGKMIPPFSASI